MVLYKLFYASFSIKDAINTFMAININCIELRDARGTTVNTILQGGRKDGGRE